MLWQIGLIVWGLAVGAISNHPVHCETIHFTNSPHSILASKNFTTYEIEVPGAKPITIIEATDPYRAMVSDGELDSREALDHQRIPSPTTSFHTSTGIRVTKPIGESSLLEGSPAGGSSRKTLYSPELLNKFLKEYSEKLRNADSLTRKRLNEITKITSGKPEEPEESSNRRPIVRGEDRIGTAEPASEEEDEAKTEDELIFDETNERNVMALGSSNKRWYQESPSHYHQQQQQQQQQHQNHHPWNVKDGWVTLEAVPWSESKVSKWHAANGADGTKKQRPTGADAYWNGGVDGEESDGSRYKPIAAIYPTGSSTIGASSYYQGELPGGDYSAEDYGGYGVIKNRPKTNGVRQTTTPATQPDSLYNRRRPVVTLYSERPDGPQVDRWYEGPQATVATVPSADPYEAMKAYHHHHHHHNPHGASPGTAHRDIITDGRPPNFPKFNPEQQHAADAYGSSVTSPNQRPVSYPDRGNGEWVLISTTKGYQYPKRRHGQRAITFSPATSTSHQSVKLTVLPMKNALDMTTSHNGLIEVSTSTQTVEDAVKEQQQHNKRKGTTPPATSAEVGISNAIPARRKQKKKQPLAAATAPGGGSFSLMHRRDAAQDSSAVLAAVGAGMVPATMAFLAPMVLGKKK
ncbi:uncharacterized protein LOC118458852 [Anopheles albimanus]|uniref:Uncharacterized protein n=1 Tax=Anopheles albimanus TaxID=7167 RepID=A0A182FKW3_ANOAL|nr:uncharacterized protein LOC118458852 [Anopheles albimanus]